jgi:choline kinase
MSSAKSIVISCAGIGSRLGIGHTKALARLNGKSIIGWQMELLKDVDDIRVVVGFQASDVVKEVLKYRRDVIFIYNHDYFHTKTGASFFLGARDANNFVVEWDGDLLVHPDDVKKILSVPGEFICYSEITSDEAVYVRTNEAMEVTGFSRINGSFEWTGPACIDKRKLRYTAGNVFEMLQPHLPMKGIKIEAYDIDTVDDFKRVSKIVENW